MPVRITVPAAGQAGGELVVNERGVETRRQKSGGKCLKLILVTAAAPAFIGLYISSVLHTIRDPYHSVVQVSTYCKVIESNVIVFEGKTNASHDAFLFCWQERERESRLSSNTLLLSPFYILL